MIAYFTRDSVCAGDDGDAPHALQIEVPDGPAIDELIRMILRAAPLPSIQGGRATWCVSSIIPLAVIAQEWSEPRLLHSIPPKLSELDLRDKTLCLHFSYFAQLDPSQVFDVLARLKTRVG